MSAPAQNDPVLTSYEVQQATAIEKWKNAPPGAVAAALGFVSVPASWLIQKVVPESAIRGALDGANWLAEQLTDTEEIRRDGGVASIADLRAVSLDRCDRLADTVHNWAIGFACAEGLAAGVAGLPGLAADIPILVTLAIRTIRKIGLCYGYDGTEENDRAFILGVLSASGSNSMAQKLEALATLKTIETVLIKKTWKSIGEKAAASTLSKEAGIIAIRNLAKQLGINITKRKALQIIPAVGAGIGATMNAAFIGDVGWAARRKFQERWLVDSGKLT